MNVMSARMMERVSNLYILGNYVKLGQKTLTKHETRSDLNKKLIALGRESRQI